MGRGGRGGIAIEYKVWIEGMMGKRFGCFLHGILAASDVDHRVLTAP